MQAVLKSDSNCLDVHYRKAMDLFHKRCFDDSSGIAVKRMNFEAVCPADSPTACYKVQHAHPFLSATAQIKAGK